MKRRREEEILIAKSHPSKKRAAKPDPKGERYRIIPRESKKLICLRLMRFHRGRESSWLMLHPLQRMLRYSSNSYPHLENILEHE